MPTDKIREKLASAEKRTAFVAAQLEGVMASELKAALQDIRDAVRLLVPDSAEVIEQGSTVLFVDDEEIIRRIGEKILSREGFHVLTASDGTEALGVFEQNREKVKCVVLDLVMPRMDGMQAYRQLRKSAPGIGIILTTGYGEEEIRKRFGTLQLQGFLRKPFTSASLVEMVRDAIMYTEQDRDDEQER